MIQVAKALSGNTTEDSSDSSDESDTDPDEGIDELKKQKADNFGISYKGVGESEESSDESEDLATTGRRDNPPSTTRTPLPLGNFLEGSTMICLVDGIAFSSEDLDQALVINPKNQFSK